MKRLIVASILMSSAVASADIIPINLPNLRVPVVSLLNLTEPLTTLLLGSPCRTYSPPLQGSISNIYYYCAAPNDYMDPDIQLLICTEGCQELTVEFNQSGFSQGVKFNGLPL